VNKENVVIAAAGNPFEIGDALSHPFAIFSDLISQLHVDNSSIEDFVERRLTASGSLDIDDSLWLLNDIIGTLYPKQKEIPDSMDILASLLADIIVGEALHQEQNLICLIDDAHCTDIHSWAVIRELSCRKECSLRVILAVKTLHSPYIDEETIKTITQVMNQVDTYSISPFTGPEVTNIVRARLNIAFVPQGVTSFLLDISCGNPLFVHSLIDELLHRELIQVDSGSQTLSFFEIKEPRSPKSKSKILKVKTSSSTGSSKSTSRKYRSRRSSMSGIQFENDIQKEGYLRSVDSFRMKPPVIMSVVLTELFEFLPHRQQLFLITASFYALDTDDTHFSDKIVRRAVSQLGISTVDEDFEQLIDKNIFMEYEESACNYCFRFELMQPIIRSRILSSQRHIILKELTLARLWFDQSIRENFNEKASQVLQNLSIKQGTIYIRKRVSEADEVDQRPKRRHKRHSWGSVWKKRFGRIFTDRLEIFNHESDDKRSGCIFLDNAQVHQEKHEIAQRPALRVHTTKWEKYQNESNQPRTFYLAFPRNSGEKIDDWLYSIEFSIESCGNNADQSEPKLTRSPSRRHSDK